MLLGWSENEETILLNRLAEAFHTDESCQRQMKRSSLAPILFLRSCVLHLGRTGTPQPTVPGAYSQCVMRRIAGLDCSVVSYRLAPWF
jgi:hypothetical protein